MKITQTFDTTLMTKLNKTVQDEHVRLYPEVFNEYDFSSVHEALVQILKSGTHEVYLAEEDGEPAGYVWFERIEKPANAFKKEYRALYIHQISVLPSSQHKGCGTRLMEKVEERASELGIQRIELDYWSDNKSAKRFYEKQGFTVFREVVQKFV
ncbi:GNAT family N-acetyltransferase [Jeotgalibacillus proteolyticus]|uniref:GNAT family N-acetyltransferase n=1 Tax=Jeotgalibacillus proteolyticus TaxID=2082395 RepID=A0A2S5G8Y6_9BACL|nr:GNAT family N-acetyltransferase [Jeotgalibacillus proteolyticus]PPA69456.1 GNAT family N-acetyltransferase [Jeotgalibacillus proteolyticus]